MSAFIRFLFTAIICPLSLSAVFAQKSTPIPAWASRYETVRPLEDVFIVSKGGKMGVVSANGASLTKLAYDTIYNFSEGMAIVGRGHREVNQFGKVLADFKYGYLNKAGRLVVPIMYEELENFNEGVGYAFLSSLPDHRWYDKKGNIELSFGHLGHAEGLKGGTSYVWIAHIGFLESWNSKQNNPFDVRGNYIDRKGRLLIPGKYDIIAPYFPGYLRPVRKNGKWGSLDSVANVAIALQYDDIDTDSAFFWQNLRRVGIAGKYEFM